MTQLLMQPNLQSSSHLLFFTHKVIYTTRSHLHVMPSRIKEPRKAMFTEWSGDVAILWQLRGVHGNDGVYMASQYL